MKICCPKCNTSINIGRRSRFGRFDCSNCKHEFMGLEAWPSWGSLFLGDHLSTSCPHCWQITRLAVDSQHGGYVGPARCCWCCKKLPQRGAYREPVCKTDYEEIVDLATGAAIPRESARQILRNIDENDDLFLTPQQKEEVKRLLKVAVAKHEGLLTVAAI